MAIGNLGDRISSSDLNTVRDIRNPPEFVDGFEGNSSSGDDSSFGFDSLDDFGQGIFSDSSDNSGGNNSGGFGGGGDQPFGAQPFGAQPFGTQPFGTQPGMTMGGNPMFPQQQQQQAQPDMMDKMFDYGGQAALSLFGVLKEIGKSLKSRNADDYGYLSRTLIVFGGGSAVGGLVVGVISSILSFKILSFSGLSLHVLLSGALCVATGFIGLGFSALKVSQTDRDSTATNIQDVPDVSQSVPDDATEDYENNVGDILDDLFGDDSDDEFSLSEDDINGSDTSDFTPSIPTFATLAPPPQEVVNYTEVLNDVRSNQYISRELLFNTFKSFFPTNTPNFSDRSEIDKNSEIFNLLEAVALKALANIQKCDIQDVKSELDSAYETFFSYELKIKRVKGIKNTDDIGREIEAYMREDADDTSVSATVSIEGDFYKAIVTKGESAVVTFGDIFRLKENCDFFLNTKNKLPIITGVTELGKVILHDAKIFDTMLIAGKPRSGKSWYVFSLIMSLAMFNTPEDVQFIVVDPKESNLFKRFALLPHVAGIHNDSNILEVMDDIITNEGARRKRLLAENKCDDIWALRNKGIKLPILYLVIDEYITVRNNLGQLDKELDNKLQIIISQLPSQGIRLMFVPHRATGVVNKTNRTMLQFTAAVRADIEDVEDTLGVKKWNRALTQPGDIAIKTSASPKALFVRGGALTTSDEGNAELMENVAKAFYKMGVDMPDMSSMRIACNRDEDEIRRELHEYGSRIQYDNIDTATI